MSGVGSRAEVYHGTKERTSGGLRKKDLMWKNGRILSKKASRAAKKSKNLKEAGWTAIPGEFGAVRIEDVKKIKKSKKIEVISIAPMISEAMKRIANSTSVSSLFK